MRATTTGGLWGSGQQERQRELGGGLREIGGALGGSTEVLGRFRAELEGRQRRALRAITTLLLIGTGCPHTINVTMPRRLHILSV